MESKPNNKASKKDPKELKGIVLKIIEVMDVERIYLNEGTEENPFKYSMTIITSLMPKTLIAQIQPIITAIFEGYTNYKYAFFSLQYANQELYRGNLYFHNQCLDRYLVYKDTGSSTPWVLRTLDFEKVYEKAKTRFKRDISKIKSFKKGIKFYLNRKDYPQAVFMVHQTYELTYRILESFIAGNVKICHSISNHQTYIEGYITPLKGTYSEHSETDKTLLKLLDDAYASSRYTHHYTITEQDLQTLNLRVSLFIKEVIRLFNQELLKFQNEVYYNATNITEANFPIKKPKNNSNKKLKRLKKIKKIKQLVKHFSGVTNETHGRHIRKTIGIEISSNEDLTHYISSLLEVCYFALDGNGIFISPANKHCSQSASVTKVIELILELLPHEQMHCLDGIAKFLETADNKDEK